MKTRIVLVSFLLLLVTAINGQDNKNEYLRKVLGNLEKIESATYDEYAETWQPGDTIPLSVRTDYVEEYDNPQDTTIGASFAEFEDREKRTFLWGYDGNIYADASYNDKEIVIDDFSSNRHPFRALGAPFFNYVKSIIRYSLTTPDSITTELTDIGDAYYFKMLIHEKQQVEFFGKDYRFDNPYSPDPTSLYEIWISKANDLPFKKRREMSHDISVEACSDIQLNKGSVKDFDLYGLFPENYEIRKKNQRKSQPTISLVGKQAPNWTLRDVNGQGMSLADFKSKVLLINFTGVGCGPCKMAIPFLNGLKNQFKGEELEVVAIESWKRKTHSIQSYINTNKINYRLLEGSEEVIQDYLNGNSAVPYYFILDKDRIVRKVIYGYGKGTTDKKIIDAINELL